MSWGRARQLGGLSGLALLALPALLPGSAAAAAPPRARVARVAYAPAGKRIAVELPLRIDARGLDRFATAVSTPGSPLYGHYESVPQLARRFGARPAVRARVTRYLRGHGATRVRIDATGLFVEATMRVGTAQRLFATALDRFHADAVTPAGGGGAAIPAATFIAPAAHPHIPAELRSAVTGVVGLDTRPLAAVTPQVAPAPVAPVSTAYPARTGTPAGCPGAIAQPGFTPNQYLTAYGYDPLHEAGLDGQGERVALIEIDGFKTSDVKAFAACFGLPVPKINAYGVGINTALPAGAESTLDLELLDAAAPKLASVDVYESQPVASEVLRSLTEPLSVKGRKPDVISASLGSCQPDAEAAIGQAGINTVEQALQLAAATGISVLASAGDTGSTACTTTTGNPIDQLAVNYPAGSPWVTGVGGTNVHLDVDNAIADPATDQVVWNDEPAGLGAGGGGVSTFAKPSYQDGFQTSSRREVPDVSMLADPLPGYEIYCTATSDCTKSPGASPWLTLGGTSAGTPLLAGGLALIDEELQSRGQENVGFANPLLYKVARSAAAALTISDVITGSNDVSGSVFGRALGCCSAAVGYDEASGLGSVNLSGLATAAATLVSKQVSVALSLPAQPHPLRSEHLLATVSCSGECLMGAYARIRLGASGLITVYSHPYELTQRRRRTIRIGLDATNRARIRAALAGHETVTAEIYGALIDASGKVVRQSPGKTLRIRS
jgi:subtilase family serine protease